MIELIPAIDLIDGQCVRLTKGDYNQKKIYNSHPAQVAAEFETHGFRRLHLVDLDGAKSSHIVNDDVLRKVVSSTNLEVDFGGGVKSDEDVRKAFEAGASYVTVGSLAVKNPDLFLSWIARYGADKFILGADVANGMISVNGWKENSKETLEEFLDYYVVHKGLKKILCTDISKDGTLSGPAVELYKRILSRYPGVYLIASGGVSSVEDFTRLEEAGVPAVVFGKAFYEGNITWADLDTWRKKGGCAC